MRGYWTSDKIGALVAVLLTAMCMRPAIVSFGPLAQRIGEDLQLSSAQLGGLASVPVLAFGLISAFVARPARHLGYAKFTLLALAVLGIGIALRLIPGAWALWSGTALVGAGIAALNVLMPAVVKQRFPERVSFVTGIYSALLVGSAAGFVALATPIAVATGDWHIALAASLPIVVVAAIATILRIRRATPEAGTAAVAPSVASRLWSSPLAWAVTFYMGMQSTIFYIVGNWIPTIEQSVGISEVDAGLHFALSQIVGVPFGFFATALMQRVRDHRPLAATAGIAGVLPVLGAIMVPGLMPLWTVIMGLIAGITLPVALALIGERAGSTAEAARLSGMAQSVGYMLAAAGPFVAGWMFQVTDTWNSVLWLVFGLTLVLGVSGWFAGTNRTIAEERHS